MTQKRDNFNEDKFGLFYNECQVFSIKYFGQSKRYVWFWHLDVQQHYSRVHHNTRAGSPPTHVHRNKHNTRQPFPSCLHTYVHIFLHVGRHLFGPNMHFPTKTRPRSLRMCGKYFIEQFLKNSKFPELSRSSGDTGIKLLVA